MTLPVALMGSDVIGQARTGTGKTFAFGLPLLQRIVAPADRDYEPVAAPGKPQALVVVPTRELAVQVTADLRTASTVRKVRLLTVYGGRAYEPQVEMLRTGVDVVVGTPGRLLDLADQGHLDLGHVKVLVLDEADKMLDLGFLPDVEKIVGLTPELRQTMLFSATMPAGVVGLARRYMRHPLNVRAESAEENQTVPATAQFVYRAHALDKDEIIARLLQAEGRGLTMIFCRTKRQAQRVADELLDRDSPLRPSTAISARQPRAGVAGVPQREGRRPGGHRCGGARNRRRRRDPRRQRGLSGGREDLPAPDWTHRPRRASGIAVTLVDWEDVARWKMINKVLDLPYDEPVETYSSSEHLFHDLGIPPGTTGRLPAQARTRAGLSAEAVEDLGETGRRRNGPRRGADKGRTRSGDDRRERRARTEHGESDADTNRENATSRRPRRSRTRQRSRAGVPVSRTTTSDPSASGSPSST